WRSRGLSRQATAVVAANAAESRRNLRRVSAVDGRQSTVDSEARVAVASLWTVDCGLSTSTGVTTVCGEYNQPVPTPGPGDPFPSIALRDETGRESAPPSGETLYSFFKTTCPTCALAWPFLDRIRRRAEGGALSVLAV